MSGSIGKTQLIEGVRWLAQQPAEDLRSEENGIFTALLNTYGSRPAVKTYIKYFGYKSFDEVASRKWHPRLQRGLILADAPKEQTRVLCAFGAVVDLVYDLDQAGLDALDSWCIQHPLNEGKQPSGMIESGVVSPRGIITSLDKAFCTRGQKPSIDDTHLRTILRGKRFPLRTSKRFLGGAAGIVAEALAQLGVDARIYSMYHSAEQAACFNTNLAVKRLDLQVDGCNLRLAHKCGDKNHPTRFTIVLSYPRDVEIQSSKNKANATDRSLLLLKHPFRARTAPHLHVCTFNGEPMRARSVIGPEEWLAVVGFVRWEITGDAQKQLAIEPVPDAILRGLAREHHYIFLSTPGLGQLQDPSDPLNSTLLHQLWVLRNAGATMHLEISGGAIATQHMLTPFANALRGVIRGLGINDTELKEFSRLPDFWSESQSQQSDDFDVYQRYLAAQRLAQALDVDRLYVHGNDVDLILRKGAAEAALQQEVLANLFTKGTVVVSILLRNGRDPKGAKLDRALYYKGFYTLLEFGWRLSHEQHQAIEQRKLIFQRIVHDGYYLAAGLDEYSVVIVPVMWPEIMNTGLNTTGAGDICSGISLLYSGWR